MDDKIIIRKNILDNHFQKQLQIASGSMIIIFTYTIGVVIASISHQVNWKNLTDATFIIIVSVFALGLAGFFFIRSARKLKRITTALENLKHSI